MKLRWLNDPLIKNGVFQMKKPEEIGNIINSIVKGMGISSKLKTSGIFNHWKEIVGEEIAKRSSPEKLIRGTLYISVSSSTWASELSLMSVQLIEKINAFAGEKVVKTIRFRTDL
jgi:predicted nucleic acid-binding Zn ribbon protein